MLLAQVSDAVWLGVIGAVVMLAKEYFDRERSKQAKIDSDKAAEVIRTQAERDAKSINDKQDANHKLLNSELIEMKRIITEAARAEGVLAGKAQQKAETDAKIVAGVEAAKAAPVAPLVSSQVLSTDAEGKKSIPVTVVAQEIPVPIVDVTKPKPKP